MMHHTLDTKNTTKFTSTDPYCTSGDRIIPLCIAIEFKYSNVLLTLQGKGLQTTYWLLGKEGFQKPLPDFKEVKTLFQLFCTLSITLCCINMIRLDIATRACAF